MNELNVQSIEHFEHLNEMLKDKEGSNELKTTFGITEKVCEDGMILRHSRNELGQAQKEYFQGDVLVKREVRTGDGICLRTEFDDMGNAYKETVSKYGAGSATAIVSDTTIVKDNFSAITDRYGRTKTVEITDVQLKESARDSMSGIKRDQSYLASDDRGHLIADSFGGPTSQENIVPMDGSVNRKVFKANEDFIREQVKDGRKVDYQVKVNYKGKGERPTSFEQTVTIDGKKFKLGKIYNKNNPSAKYKVKASTVEKIREFTNNNHRFIKGSLESAAFTAGVTGAISTVDNLKKYFAGEISIDAAVTDIFKDMGLAGGMDLGLSGLRLVSEKACVALSGSSKLLLKGLGKFGIPTMLITYAIESYDVVMDFAQGKITGEQFAYEMGRNAAGTLGATALGIIGTEFAGPLGTMIGGMIGYMVATTMYDSLAYLGEKYLVPLVEKTGELANDVLSWAGDLIGDGVEALKSGMQGLADMVGLPINL